MSSLLAQPPADKANRVISALLNRTLDNEGVITGDNCVSGDSPPVQRAGLVRIRSEPCSFGVVERMGESEKAGRGVLSR